MDSAITALTLVAVLVFSLACALLLEEMIFGGLFRLFFAPVTQNKRRTNRQDTELHY